jgi:hypothetical protein
MDKMNDAKDKLARFAVWAIEMHRDHECADIDGASIQEALVDFGILTEHTMTEPCGECCVCADFGEQDEWQCYVLADDVCAVRDAIKGVKP